MGCEEQEKFLRLAGTAALTFTRMFLKNNGETSRSSLHPKSLYASVDLCFANTSQSTKRPNLQTMFLYFQARLERASARGASINARSMGSYDGSGVLSGLGTSIQSLAVRKQMMLEEARRKYIEKHNIVLPQHAETS